MLVFEKIRTLSNVQNETLTRTTQKASQFQLLNFRSLLENFQNAGSSDEYILLWLLVSKQEWKNSLLLSF